MVLYITLATVMVLVCAALWSSFHRVSEGDLEILLVFGEGRDVLEPGTYMVPPFVSGTYPVDTRTMQYESSYGRRSVPSELREEVEMIAEDRTKAAEVQP